MGLENKRSNLRTCESNNDVIVERGNLADAALVLQFGNRSLLHSNHNTVRPAHANLHNQSVKNRRNLGMECDVESEKMKEIAQTAAVPRLTASIA